MKAEHGERKSNQEVVFARTAMLYVPVQTGSQTEGIAQRKKEQSRSCFCHVVRTGENRQSI
jgi:hypothetical protein